ncbi:MAG: metallophosphoesterase [Nitrososphaerota archaeon]|nr:metallophosphoesterase [Nitrososphaerota archaeon]
MSICEESRHDFSYTLRSKIQSVSSNFASKSGWRSFNAKDFQVIHLKIKMAHLASVFCNYRIVHISDIHYGQWVSSERLGGIVELVNQICPDAVVVTGDFVSYLLDKGLEEELVLHLGRLQSRDGVFAVLGNHDHWAGADRVRGILKRSGIIDVSNEVYVVERGGFRLVFAGVDSVMMGKARLDVVLEKMPLDDPAVLLVHEPDFALTTAFTRRFGLQLSGHSHGGQFRIPGLGTPFRGRYARWYPHGLYDVGGMALFTSSGLGTNSYWLRVNCPPQIVVVSLV